MKSYSIMFLLCALICSTTVSCKDKSPGPSSVTNEETEESFEQVEETIEIEETQASKKVGRLYGDYRGLTEKVPITKARFKIAELIRDLKETRENLFYWIDIRRAELEQSIEEANSSGNIELERKYQEALDKLNDMSSQIENGPDPVEELREEIQRQLENAENNEYNENYE